MIYIAHIYKITNITNNKVYIGETIRTIRERWNQHVHEARTEGHGHMYPIHVAMSKYGIENFTIEELEECPDEMRFERETYYIRKYESLVTQQGYNIVLEGRGSSKYASQEIMQLWREGLGINEIASKIGCDKSVVSKRIRGCGVSEEEIKERISQNLSLRQSRGLEQYSLNGKLVKVWPSASACEKECGYAQTALSNVARMKQISAYGYLWKMADDKRDISNWTFRVQNKKDSGRPKKKVARIDKETLRVLEVYDSAADAARSMGLKDKSNLCRAARTNGNAYGFKWIYIEE